MEEQMDIEYCVRKRKPVEQPYKLLQPSMFNHIASEIRREKHLLEAAPGCLQFSYEDGFGVVVLTKDGRPVGHTRLHFLLGREHRLGGWLELGSTWVHKDFRGNGINREMYRLLLPLHNQQYNIVATTTNVGSLAVGEEFGFVSVHRKSLPPEVWQNSCCCPLSKTGASEPNNHDCQLAHGEPQQLRRIAACWFRVTPETAARLNLESALV